MFVSKLNAAGSALVYSTYLGGSNDDYGYGIAVDGSGSAYVTGQALSTDFPTTPEAFDTSSNCSYDAFLTKLDAAASAPAYSTYLGGTVNDWGNGIVVDGSGSAYVTGTTASGNFPTTPAAFDIVANGSNDAFVTKLDAAGSALGYSTYLGGGDPDSATG